MDGNDWLHLTRPTINKQPNARPVRFRDLNPDYTQDKNPLILEEETAIRARMRFVLSNLIGAEDFLPGFASNLPLRLYDSVGRTTGFLMEMDTLIALTDWMSDEIIVGANVKIVPLEDEDGYQVDIPFVIRRSNKPSMYSFEILR